jgi:RimJ/RimL family protein N-acetyltransferase
VRHELPDGVTLLTRAAAPEDATAVLAYIEAVSAESEFLTFGPGEFTLSAMVEAEVLRQYAASENQLYLLGTVDDDIVATAILSAAPRARIRHSGELGMSVRRPWWGHGVGSVMLDAVLAWARATGILTKINLRVRTDNERAMRLYRRKGFVFEGTLRRELCVRGVYFDTHCLGIEL